MNKSQLEKLYIIKKKSAFEISKEFKCSESKVNYWLRKHKIPKRSISESQYLKQNPGGDPFKITKVNTDSFLFGLGIGLYWGEGTKASKNSVRLGNTDPDLLIYFIKFLERYFNIDTDKLKFGLQIFNDNDEKKVKQFWKKKMNIKESQFYKVTVSPSQSTGTYKKRAEYGVLTIYFNNTKLRNILCHEIEKLRHL